MSVHKGDLEYRPDIDGLRAIAVLAVVIFHMSPRILSGGYIGVDVFFVISGYLISLIIFKKSANNSFTVKDFYIRRTKRIFPTLIVVLLATWGLGFCFLLKDEFRNLGKHIYSGAFFFSNFTLWGEAGYFDVASEMKPLLHLWSLSIEEQFYIFWPLLAAFAIKRNWNTIALIFFIIASSLVLNLVLVESHFTSTFFLLHTRAWELLAGALLAWLEFSKSEKLKSLQPGTKNILSVLGLIFIIVPCFLFSDEDLFPGWRAIFPVLGAFFLITTGPNAWVNKHVLSLKAMVWVGLISYPLYLWHWPLLSYARILDAGEAAAHIRVILIALAFLLSWLTYQFIEQPIRIHIPKAKEGKYSLLIVFVLFLVGSLGLLSKNQKSWKILSGSEQEELFKIPSYTTGACTKKFPVSKDAYCNLSGESPEIAVIGDSFSLALYPGLGNYFRDQGKGIIHFGRGSCPPLMGIKVKTKGETEFCSGLIDEAMKRILNIDSIKKVVLVARWSAYLDESQVAEFGPAGTLRTDVLQTGLMATLETFRKANKEVVLVHAVPDLGFDPKSCLKLRKFQLTAHNANCSVDKKTVEAQQEAYRRVFDTVQARFPEVKTFDPLPFLCQNDECRGKMNEVLLYRDKTHLSIAGSKALARQFDF